MRGSVAIQARMHYLGEGHPPKVVAMPDTQRPPYGWQPERSPPADALAGSADPDRHAARRARGLCPACGQTHAFIGYLRVVPQCVACGAPLGELRADDAPPYFTVFIVAHVVIGLMFETYLAFDPPFWVQAAIWLPATAILSMALLRPVKGATLGLMLKLGMTKSADEVTDIHTDSRDRIERVVLRRRRH